MKKIIPYVLLLISCLAISCEKSENPYKNLSDGALSERIEAKQKEILLATSPVPCTDPKEWKMADIQTVCGLYHIPYHQSVDEKKLRSLIHDLSLLVEIYRPKIAPVINCAAYRAPIGIVCEDGKAVIKFEPFEEEGNE